MISDPLSTEDKTASLHYRYLATWNKIGFLESNGITKAELDSAMRKFFPGMFTTTRRKRK